MKIQSINSFNYVQKSAYVTNPKLKENSTVERNNQEENLLKDTTYNSAFINFRAKPPKISLDEKLTSIFFNNFSEGDAILLGRNFDQVVAGLKRNAREFDTMLDRLFFIKDSGLAVPLAIIKINDEFTQVHNIGKKDVLIVRPSCTKTLEPHQKTLINDGDIIINNRRNIPISFEDNGVEYDPLKMVDKTFSFQPTKINTIENFNIKMVERISNDESDEVKKSVEVVKNQPVNDKKTFKDVGGLDNVIKSLKKEIVYPINFPYAYKDKQINKGFVLYGPPGTGKTHIATALANEVNAKFIELNGLEMEDSLVGQSEKNWRKLFDEAKKNQPCVLFIDEIDAVAKKRSGKDVYGDKVVNQLLTLIGKNQEENDKVFIIGATNMMENLDPAITRAKRLSRLIEIPPPDEKGLSQIFDIQTRKIALDKNVDKTFLISEFAKRKFTGADTSEIIANAHNNSWERAGIYEKMENNSLTEDDITETLITQEDFLKALKEYRPELNKNNRNSIGFKKQ